MSVFWCAETDSLKSVGTCLVVVAMCEVSSADEECEGLAVEEVFAVVLRV